MLLESILWNYRLKLDSKISICRLSNIYGGYTKEDLNDSTYLKLMVRSKLEGGDLSINQNILNTKGYIFIDDAIQGLIHSAVYANESDIYNICSGESYSIGDWLKYLKVNYNIIGEQKTSLHSKISIKKAVDKLNFQPQYYLRNIEFEKIFHYGSK